MITLEHVSKVFAGGAHALRDTVFGPLDRAVEDLPPTFRTHGSRHESDVPLVVYGAHVDAKRYLVATDPSYAARLSDTSRRSLALQGGPFSWTEAQRLESSPHAGAAIRLHRWDDAAKVAGLAVPPLRSFGGLMGSQMDASVTAAKPV